MKEADDVAGPGTSSKQQRGTGRGLGVWDRSEATHQVPTWSPWRTQAAAPPGHKRQAGSSNAALAAIKVAHTLAWSSIESCMVYVLYAGFARRSDRRVAMAAGSGQERA